MDTALEDVNGLLSQLNLGVSGAQQEDGAKFEQASSFVVEQVRTLERALARQHAGGGVSQEEGKSEARGLVDVAIARGMPRPDGGTDDSTARAEALGFMRSELQVLCMEAHRRRKQNQPLLAGLELTATQRQTAERVNAAIAADFALRRRMLLRRCDVTVQSFLRSGAHSEGVQQERGVGGTEKVAGGGETGVGGGEGGEFVNLPPALRAKRQALSDKPRGITVDDALAAPVALARQHSQRITTEGHADGGGISDNDNNPTKPTTKISIKMAEIAEVSDRGGRVGDARSGPSWKSQKEFDKAAAAAAAAGGGRGGGGRGGGGGRSGKRGGKKGGGGGGQGKKEGGGRRGGGGSGGGEGHAGGEARGGGRGGGNKRKRGGRGERAPR